MVVVLLVTVAGSASPSQAQAWTVFPAFWRTLPSERKGPSGASPVSSRSSRRAASRSASPGATSPLGMVHAPASRPRQKGPPGWASSTSMSPCRRRKSRMPALTPDRSLKAEPRNSSGEPDRGPHQPIVRNRLKGQDELGWQRTAFPGPQIDEHPCGLRPCRFPAVRLADEEILSRRGTLVEARHPGVHRERIAEEERTEVLDEVGPDDPGRSDGPIALQRPARRRRVLDRDLLHPGHVGQVVHVAVHIDGSGRHRKAAGAHAAWAARPPSLASPFRGAVGKLHTAPATARRRRLAPVS